MVISHVDNLTITHIYQMSIVFSSESIKFEYQFSLFGILGNTPFSPPPPK